MIALLFSLLAVAMLLAFADMRRLAYVIFAVTMVMSVYWLKFHATSALTIQL